MKLLTLVADEFIDDDHWLWRLTDAQGVRLAEHRAALGASSGERFAFYNLHQLKDLPTEQQTPLVNEIGQWVGAYVLGDVARALRAAAPATVIVVTPSRAALLRSAPLEIAHVDGEPLALQGVSFVYQLPGDVEDDPYAEANNVPKAIRMLAAFSLPVAEDVLALRQERHSLAQLASRLASSKDSAFELKIGRASCRERV